MVKNKPHQPNRMATGAGRSKSKLLTLDADTIAALIEVGDGNASEGCRRLAHDWLRRQERKNHRIISLQTNKT